MLFLEGVGVEEFIARQAAGTLRLDNLRCPDPGCGGRFHCHGSYVRYLSSVQHELPRVVCTGCGVTHGVLPEDVCAYRDLTLGVLEDAVDAGSPSPAAEVLDPALIAARRAARRLLRSFRKEMEAVAGWLPAMSQRGLEGLREIFGSAPGVLVRLRRWLMSRLGLWFSGLCGLWRHGRPPHQVRRSSHKPW